MFLEISFWQVFGITTIGLVVGMITTFIIFIILDVKLKHHGPHKDLIDFTISSSMLLIVSLGILVFTLPISRWFEFCLIGFGVSGFAVQWLGLTIGGYMYDKVDSSLKGRLTITFIFTFPTMIVGILIGIVNHYWLHVFK